MGSHGQSTHATELGASPHTGSKQQALEVSFQALQERQNDILERLDSALAKERSEWESHLKAMIESQEAQHKALLQDLSCSLQAWTDAGHTTWLSDEGAGMFAGSDNSDDIVMFSDVTAEKSTDRLRDSEKSRWSLSDDALINEIRQKSKHSGGTKRNTIQMAADEMQEGRFFTRLKLLCMHLVRKVWFDQLISVVIGVNATFVMADVQRQSENIKVESDLVFIIAQCTFSAIYVIELGIRINGLGWSFFISLDRYWNVFDVVVVACSLVDLSLIAVADLPSSTTIFVRVMRVLRIAKILRIVRFLRQVRSIAYTLAQTLPSLVWSSALVAIVMYVFSVLLTTGVTEFRSMHGHADDDMYILFGSFGRCMLTLLMTITGGLNWQDATDQLERLNSPFYMVFFLSYVVFMNIAMLNVVTGFFCEHAFEMARCDKDSLIQEQLRKKRTYIRHFQSYFDAIDADGSGTISFSELESMMEDDKMQAYLSHLNISSGNAWHIFRLIDTDGGGSVDIDEFVTGLLTMKGPARNLDVRSLAYDLQKFMSVVSEFMKFADDQLTGRREPISDKTEASLLLTSRREPIPDETKASL